MHINQEGIFDLSPKLEKSSSSHQSIYNDQFDAKKLPQLWLDNVVKRFIPSQSNVVFLLNIFFDILLFCLMK